jgi:hypothetical protein
MHRLNIWLLALVFVFNGAAFYALIAPAESQAAIVQDDHHARSGAKYEAQCKQVADDEIAAAAADHDHAHHHAHKCCGVCNFASLMPAPGAIPVTFSYRAITFRIGQHDLVAHPVGLDPEIPKTAV